MSRAECSREQEVLDAIAANRWPHKLGEELTQHVEGCSFCKDLGLVAEALSEDFSSAIAHARIPTPGLVWWRAEIRLRQESLRAASRPITLAHYVGAGCALTIAIVLLSFVDFGDLTGLSFMSMSGLIPESLPLPMLFATVGAFAALASVALYYVFSDK